MTTMTTAETLAAIDRVEATINALRTRCATLSRRVAELEERAAIAGIARSAVQEIVSLKADRDALRAEVEALRESLGEILDYRGGASHALDDDYVIERAKNALARAEARNV